MRFRKARLKAGVPRPRGFAALLALSAGARIGPTSSTKMMGLIFHRRWHWPTGAVIAWGQPND
jgi:hypothetical protein